MAIQLRRSDRYAIHLVFSPGAIDSVMAAFRGATIGEPVELPIAFDPGVVKSKRHDALVPTQLVIEASDEEAIVSSGGAVYLRLDVETLAYGLERLAECKETGVFDPAELCELRAGARSDPNDLYCIVSPEA